MQIFIERTNENKTIDFKGTAEQLCTLLKINPQTVLILKDGELVTEDEELTNTNEIKLLTVVSGG